MAAISLHEHANSTQASTGPTHPTSTIPSAQADHNAGITSVDTQTGIGIGIAIAICILLLVLGILWLLLVRRKRQDRTNGAPTRGVFDSVGSTLVSARHLSIPLQDLHEKDGAASTAVHEVSAVPPTREGGPAEMPTIWNEGYRGRSGGHIRRDSQLTLQVSRDSRPGERADGGADVETPRSGWLESETPRRETPEEAATRASEEDARYTFLID